MSYFVYIARCADGSLYTGITTDVRRRMQEHNSGTGAKYTRSRGPVEPVYVERQPDRAEASRRERRIKLLTREQKEQLVGSAQGVTAAFLEMSREEPFADFQRKLIPTVEPQRILGVRTPTLRAFAKKLNKRADKSEFLGSLPHCFFEEDQLHAFVICLEKDYDQAVRMLNEFLPHVDNWATCDQMMPKVLRARPAETLEWARCWIASEHAYTRRYGLGVLRQHFLDDEFREEHFALVVDSVSDEYYVNMARAWYVAEALAKQPEAALRLLESNRLDAWTHNKAIQKARESFRVADEVKERARLLKRSMRA